MKKLGIILIVIVLLLGIVLIFNKKEDSSELPENVVFTDEIITPEPTVTVEPTPTPYIKFNSDLIVTSDTLEQYLIDLVKIDYTNLSSLEHIPVSFEFFSEIINDMNVINTVGHGSSVVVEKLGYTDDSYFMIFSTQTSRYYIKGSIINNKIDSLTYKEIY